MKWSNILLNEKEQKRNPVMYIYLHRIAQVSAMLLYIPCKCMYSLNSENTGPPPFYFCVLICRELYPERLTHMI
jgi:hypothetical protein